MGRNNKRYQKDLKQQIHERLTGMLAIGESKTQAKLDGSDKDKIFSFSTYHTYKKHCMYFASYLKSRHPECTTLKKARKYANEWLEYRANLEYKNGYRLSAWTITLERQAIGKLLGIAPDDPDFFMAPQRRREDIKRSRGDVIRDKHFSERNNDEFVKFCKGTGCRRNVLEKLRGKDLMFRKDMERQVRALVSKSNISQEEHKRLTTLKDALTMFPDQDYFLYHHRDKGGRSRYAPIVGKNKDKIIERMQDTAPNDLVWRHVPSNADIHSYRADYALTVYKMTARPLEEIPFDRVNTLTGKRYQSDVYICRKDEKGKRMDRAAMKAASKALGHNRIDVVAISYIRGL